MNTRQLQRIVIDPERAPDGPLLRDTGVSVDQVLGALAIEPNATVVLHQFPALDLADVRAAIEFARDALHGPVASLPPKRIADLGWTSEQAARVRQQLQPFADDWDDPSMDVYDALTPAR